MSGGAFEYNQYRIEDIAREIDHLIKINDSKELNEWGEKIGFGFPLHIIEKFEAAAHTLRQAADMTHIIDYLVSGDTGENSFMKSWKEDVRDYYNTDKAIRDIHPEFNGQDNKITINFKSREDMKSYFDALMKILNEK